jgi:hypothetical protein
MQPNVGVARRAQLEIDSVDGGIMVNSELQARSHIYAVCAARRRARYYLAAVSFG